MTSRPISVTWMLRVVSKLTRSGPRTLADHTRRRRQGESQEEVWIPRRREHRSGAASAASPCNRSDHFAVLSQRLDHFGQAGEAEANGNASVPTAASWRCDGRKRSSSHSAALRSVVSNPSVNRS
jgi:hypothetical protein